MSGGMGAGRKRGRKATAPVRYPILPHPTAMSIAAGSEPWYKATPKSRAVRRDSEWGIVPLMAETTELSRRKGPTLR